MTLIANLRSRPAFERWVLAVCAYAAIAAVIIALWVVSFRDNITRIPEISGQRQASPDAPALPLLLSPFETLSQTSRQVRERFAEVLAGAERIGRGEEEPKEALPSEAEITVRYATGGDTAARGAPADLPAKAPPAGRAGLASAGALPAAGRLGEGGAAVGPPAGTPPANLTAKPKSVAPLVAGRLTTADLSGERPRTIEDPLARPSNRLGFFSALASVLAAIVHSFTGLVR